MNAASPAALATCLPTDAEIEATLAPFVMARMAEHDPRFVARRARQVRKYRYRRARRVLLGWLPEGKRTQAYVEQSYDRTFVAHNYLLSRRISEPV